MGFIFVVPFIVFIAIFISVVVISIKGREQVEDTMETMINDIKQKRLQQLSNETKDEGSQICEYCGSKIKESDNKCPSCGAGRKK